MLMKVKKALLATTMSALVLAPAAAVMTVASADAAFAKSDKAKGKSKSKKERGAKSRGSEKSAGKGKANAPGQLKKQAAAAATGDGVTAVSTSPRPNTRGKSWKTRLDSEMLQTHPSELGAWNSAKRNPNAIANLVEKYRETGEANGAGGMIAALVVAYEDYNDAAAPAISILQAAVDGMELSKDDANAILSGGINSMTISDAVSSLNGDAPMVEVELADGTTQMQPAYVVAYDGTAVSCSGTMCDLVDTSVLNAQAEALSSTITVEETDADGNVISSTDYRLEDYVAMLDDEMQAVADANATIVPNKSPDDAAVQEMMQDDVLDLLDLGLVELSDPEPAPAPEGDAI